MFTPSRHSYADAESTAEALAPLAIAAGAEVAETALTGRRKHHHRKRHPPGAPPPPAPSHSPEWPVVAGAVVLVAGVAYVATRKPKAA